MKVHSNPDQSKQKRLAEVCEKIDRGLRQLDEGRGISSKDARARLRQGSASESNPIIRRSELNKENLK